MAKRELSRPKKLSVETTAPDASKTFTYWLKTVNVCVDYLGEGRAADAPVSIERGLFLAAFHHPSTLLFKMEVLNRSLLRSKQPR